MCRGFSRNRIGDMQAQLSNGRLYVVQDLKHAPLDGAFRIFRPTSARQFQADDCGPLNMLRIIRFIKDLDKECLSFPDCKIIFYVHEGKRNLTNAVFLLGTYLILKEDLTPREVANSFSDVGAQQIEPYRQSSSEAADLALSVLDCWKGLAKSKIKAWIRFSESTDHWGEISIAQYLHFEEPGNGDLQEVVPGKFIAFKGPVDLGDHEYHDDATGVREFSPSYYVDVFRNMGVSTIIRLSEPRYDAAAFTSHGFEHFDLEFEDCTAPPDDMVAAFFRIVDSAPGAVAVHCSDGLGRTGTLISLHLMRSHGFTGREAMGWLRIMRPGSVIGEQQRYLCAVHERLRACRSARVPAGAESS